MEIELLLTTGGHLMAQDAEDKDTMFKLELRHPFAQLSDEAKERVGTSLLESLHQEMLASGIWKETT